VARPEKHRFLAYSLASKAIGALTVGCNYGDEPTEVIVAIANLRSLELPKAKESQ
jgi:hypothetical protein